MTKIKPVFKFMVQCDVCSSNSTPLSAEMLSIKDVAEHIAKER